MFSPIVCAFAQTTKPKSLTNDSSTWVVSGQSGGKKAYSGEAEFSYFDVTWRLNDGTYQGLFAQDPTGLSVGAAFGLGKARMSLAVVLRVDGAKVTGWWAENTDPYLPPDAPVNVYYGGRFSGTLSNGAAAGESRIVGKRQEASDDPDAAGTPWNLALRTVATPVPGWEILEITWTNESGVKTNGIGLRHGNVIATGICDRSFGVVLLDPKGDGYEGAYVLLGKKTLSTQVLTKKP